MPWVTSNAGGSGYAWSALNTYNQHAAKITLPVSCVVTKLRIVAAGYNTGTVPTRCVIWNVGGTVKDQSATFNMADGSASTQYTYERNVINKVSCSAGNYWVGLYRDPTESHIFQTTSGSGDGYRKTNTSGFPNVYSMSGYNTDSNDEPTVGAFYITAPSNQSGQSVSRNSDTSQTITWTRNASSDQPVHTQYLERWDNINQSWYFKHIITTDYTSNGNHSYTDTTTGPNKYYRYRLRSYNDAGYSSYVYTNYINTTPAEPSNVVGTRSGSSIVITWTDNSSNEDNFEIARRGSNDGGDTWGSWDYATLTDVGAGVTTKTDTSPSHTTMQYAVRSVEADDSLNSPWVWSNEVVVLSTPDDPTGLLPNNTYFDASEDQDFSWNHNATDGTDQTKFSLTYKVSGGSYPGTDPYDEEVSADEEVTIPGATFTNGNTYLWRVKTWGDYGTGSDWSAEGEFTCTTRPVATLTDPTAVADYGYSELTVEWSYTQEESNDQVQYLCRLYDESDNLLETKQVGIVVTSGDDGTCTFDYTLSNDTNYKVTLQVQEGNGLWSTETEVEFTTSFLQPMKPSLSLSLNESEGSVDITITNQTEETEFDETTTQDSFVDSGSPDTNYNSEDLLTLEFDTGDTKKILVDFDLPDLDGKTITSASLVLYRALELGTGYSHIEYVDTAWDETTVTDNNVSIEDGTSYDIHAHTPGDSETWDVSDLIQDIADGIVTNFEGFAVIPLGTGGNFNGGYYNKTESGKEPSLLIEVAAEYSDNDYNTVYRSVNGGSWEVVETNIPENTTITDYIPHINGNNNYYVQTVSSVPSTNNSDEEDIDIEMTGMFFINGGENFEDVVRLIGDVSITENIERNEVVKQFAGRTYPIKYQGNSKIQNLNFSADCPITLYDNLVNIIEYVGDIFYRDWRGRWFYVKLSSCIFNQKDNLAYQFSCNMTRIELNS